MQKITPFLWFDRQAEEAASLYVSLFKNSKITSVSRYPENSPGGEAGSVMMVEFELDGQKYSALNGGPLFPFNESISFMVHCADQEEVDQLWEGLTAGGQEVQCGWLKDKFGVSWQIVPDILAELMSSPDKDKTDRVYQAMLKMVKLNIEELQKAYNGG